MKETSVREHKRLLLIEDDPNQIVLVRDYLEFRGYEVIIAENGRVALEVLEQETPDLIICDVMMPEMDGYELVGKLQQDERWKGVPVIFLSAKGNLLEHRIKGLQVGGTNYLGKPFEAEELVAMVESALRDVVVRRQHTGGGNDSESKIQVPHDVHLTQTELKVVQFVARGLANRDIAEELNVSQRTVESHVSNMLGKTGLHNRTELARWAIENQMA
ncbi:MAG TPA: response regulator transcription factor [Leptolyngbyaceae cyanobacterium]